MSEHLQFVLDPDMQILKCIILLWLCRCMIPSSQPEVVPCPSGPDWPDSPPMPTTFKLNKNVIHIHCSPNWLYCSTQASAKVFTKTNAQLHHLHWHGNTIKRLQLYTPHTVKIITLQKSIELWVELPELQGFWHFHFVWKKYCHNNKLYISWLFYIPHISVYPPALLILWVLRSEAPLDGWYIHDSFQYHSPTPSSHTFPDSMVDTL